MESIGIYEMVMIAHNNIYFVVNTVTMATLETTFYVIFVNIPLAAKILTEYLSELQSLLSERADLNNSKVSMMFTSDIKLKLIHFIRTHVKYHEWVAVEEFIYWIDSNLPIDWDLFTFSQVQVVDKCFVRTSFIIFATSIILSNFLNYKSMLMLNFKLH